MPSKSRNTKNCNVDQSYSNAGTFDPHLKQWYFSFSLYSCSTFRFSFGPSPLAAGLVILFSTSSQTGSILFRENVPKEAPPTFCCLLFSLPGRLFLPIVSHIAVSQHYLSIEIGRQFIFMSKKFFCNFLFPSNFTVSPYCIHNSASITICAQWDKVALCVQIW